MAIQKLQKNCASKRYFNMHKTNKQKTANKDYCNLYKFTKIHISFKLCNFKNNNETNNWKLFH